MRFISRALDTTDVYVGDAAAWLPVVAALGLVLASVPALADRTTVHVRDEGALLVGEPTGEVQLRFGQQVPDERLAAGTYVEYEFAVDPSSNRLEVDLRYDAATLAAAGPCLKANDLDLYVEGPDWQRSYPGCDGGSITVLSRDVPTGEYTVRVEASRGSTFCLPLDPSLDCTVPEVEYSLELHVWDVQS